MEGRRRYSVQDDDETEEIKKGPWKPEEDRVLVNHVRKYGPRDWSSIRSKGLLQRTGKSCRLRWVNKLRPNLKSGVKFSAEEERTVIDLQAQFGNKWAKIATYLAGRTDNDVKNFWSSRQKRLARILQSASRPPSTPSSSSSKSRKFNSTKENKVPSFSSDAQAPKLQELMKNSMPCSSSHIPDFETIRSVPLLELAYPTHGLNYENIPFFNPYSHLSSVPLIPELQPDFPLPTETQELVTRLGEPDFFDDFGHSNGSALGNSHLPIVPSFLGPHESSSQFTSGHSVDSFVDDLPPIDMFYHIEPLPSPSDWS